MSIIEFRRYVQSLKCVIGIHAWYYSRIEIHYKSGYTGEQRFCLSCRKSERLAAYTVRDWE
jgi:hypothetical protein